MSEQPIINCVNLVKIYKTADIEVIALQGLDIKVNEGEIIAVIGNSGSGKSSLLNIIGGLDSPSAGKVEVDGKDISKLSYKEKVMYKRNTVGFVWQNSARNLIPYLTALENIKLVMKIRGIDDEKLATKLLENVGLSDKKHRRLGQLSGGEQQRVAIATGISGNPKILLADEPTGAVDSSTASSIMDTFKKLQNELGLTIFIVTHDTKLTAKVDRVVLIRDGRVSSEYIKRNEVYTSEFIEDFGEQSHDEYTVLDSVGRLQIPLEIMERAGLREYSKVKLSFEDGKLFVIPYNEV
jgi:ABC-type lipoprotein export system ATPase subunit